MPGFLIVAAGVVVAGLVVSVMWRRGRRTAGVGTAARPAGERPARRSMRGRDLSPAFCEAASAEEAPVGAPPEKGAPARRPMDWDDVDPQLRRHLEERIESLSTLPTMMNQLVGLLQDIDSDPREIARAASTDPAVVAEVLRTVNSSFYGLRIKLTDVGRAVLLLGYSRVKLLVLRLGIHSSLQQDDAYKQRLGAVWRHSFLTSEVVAHLIQTCCAPTDKQASTAALLHDLGKLLLLDLRPRDDLNVGNVFHSGSRPMEERIFVEEDYFGVNHCLIGARVAHKLQLSDMVKTVQSLHHYALDDPQIATLDGSLVRCIAAVKLGNLLAHAHVDRGSRQSREDDGHAGQPPDLAPLREYFPRLPNWEQLTLDCEPSLREASSFLGSWLPPEEPAVSVPSPERSVSESGNEPPSIAGRYTLLEKLGEGSVGSVYLCEDALLGQRFAIKIMRATPDQATPALQVFVNEVRVALRLAHPNIVRVFHFDQRDGVNFILQEYLEGRSLARLLDRSGCGGMGEERVVAIGAQLADALAYAHENGVIHRDVNPNNVIVDDAGRIKLLDFGVAACKSLTGAGEADSWGYVAGTPSYMSPEHWLGIDKVDPRSDIYSLGVVLYSLLAGRLPFAGRTSEKLREAQRSGHVAPLTAVSEQLQRLVMRCLAADPAARWPDCRTLAEQLRRIHDRIPAGSPAS